MQWPRRLSQVKDGGIEKAGEDGPLRLFHWALSAARSVPLERENFVLDAEFLALQIVDRLLVRKGTMGFLIEGTLEHGMLLSEFLDAILQRHKRPPARRYRGPILTPDRPSGQGVRPLLRK